MQRGEEVKGEFRASSGTGGEISLYDPNGNSRTLQSDERLVVTDATMNVGAAGLAGIYLDADDDNSHDDGESVLEATLGANGVLQHTFCVPVYGQKGAKPHMVHASGSGHAVITGYILKV